MERVALDTSACIELFKGNPLIASFMQKSPSLKPCLPSVAFFELMLRTYRIEDVEAFASQAELLSFDESAARKSAEISKELGSYSEIVGSRDIFIAATAIVNGCALVTFNTKHFSRIKGLKLVKIS